MPASRLRAIELFTAGKFAASYPIRLNIWRPKIPVPSAKQIRLRRR